MARMMRVGVGGVFSEWVEVVSGVLQGLVLGPLLFILYVNDLPQWIKSSMRMFADDAKVRTIVNSQEDSLSLHNELFVWLFNGPSTQEVIRLEQFK
jgi:ribonucleases P/MRP protein subunit RPP40